MIQTMYKRKLQPVEAIQWTGDNSSEVKSFLDLTWDSKIEGTFIFYQKNYNSLVIEVGDWIVEEQGVYHTCKAEDLNRMYMTSTEYRELRKEQLREQ